LAELHAEMHSYRAPDLPPRKHSLAERIESLAQLSAHTKQAVLDLLDALPDGEALLHGDFHPNNIMLCGADALVIDWIDASKGAPLADVARTSILLTERRSGRVPLSERIFGSLRDWFGRVYLERYFQLRPEERESLDRWRVVMAAARLWEGIPEFEQHLLGIVESGLVRL
jgi:aminoglycoside phosphotransferase (APT) family kinase protein